MKKKTNRTYIGGQAVIQGVMMRGKSGMATVVRDDSGQLRTEAIRITPPEKKSVFWKIPIFRGVLNFVSSLVLGMKALTRSADAVITEEEETPPSKLSKWMADHWKISVSDIISFVSVFFGVVLALALFLLLPQFLAGLAADSTDLFDRNDVWYCLLEGGMRLVIFVLYILFTLCFKSLRETYMYHGAEHKTINCYEYGMPLTVENVKKCSRLHDRCGTTFIFLVLLISIIIFALVSWPLGIMYTELGIEGIWARLISFAAKLICLPLVAGISYEILKFAALFQTPLLLPLKAPGYLLQCLTTREPDDGMIECAIEAFRKTYEMDEDPESPEKYFVTETKLLKLLADMKRSFAARDIDEADAEWIVSLGLNIPRSELTKERVITRTECGKLLAVFEKRLMGRPLWYIIGDTDFYGYKLKVDERVLIPRPETEELVREALAFVKNGDNVLDLCTGSGAIAVAIACEANKDKAVYVTASDISADALEVAKYNARINKASITFVQSDLFKNIRGKFELITANPPYIKHKEIETLPRDVKDYEPRIALDGGEDGLDFYRAIAEKVSRYIARGGMVMLEVGEGQAQDVIKIFRSTTRCDFAMVVKDLQGVERVVKIGF